MMPFDRAARMLEALLGVQVSDETARRLTEQVGSWMEAAQHVESPPNAPPEPREEPGLHRRVISCDGTMVSLVKKQWVEVRTVAIGEPVAPCHSDDESEIRVGLLSYFSRLADAATFTELAEVEVQRRQVRSVDQVCAVMDGADWCQRFTERYRPDAVRILDFPHAAEHLSQLLEAVEHVGIPVPSGMLDRCLHILKHRGPKPLLRLAGHLEGDLAHHKGVQGHLDYFRKRETFMQYPQFREQGWPIGSGMVESANKLVVQARLKGPGMHWERTHVNPMLALRAAVCNDRWQEMWQQALKHYRQQQVLQRSARPETQEAPSLAAVGNSSCLSSPSTPSQAISEIEALPVTPPPPVPSETQPSFCRLSSRRKQHTARNRVKYADQKSSEMSGEGCPCGAPLVQFKGHRPKQYYSDRCRQRAYRKRQTQTEPCAGSSHAPVAHRTRRVVVLRMSQVRVSSQRVGGVRGETCLFCGVRLSQSQGGRMREYCSGCCRQRAHRERKAQVS